MKSLEYAAGVARRSYGQHCGLAVALDVIAQRWALLIIRDLAPGPRRFTDLFTGLPGISTDMLTERLRQLEAAGAVEQVELTHPVPGTVYQLTGRGHELARIGGDLARWGAPLLPAPGTTPLRRSARWALQSFASHHRGGLQGGVYHFVLDGAEELTLRVEGDGASLTYGGPTSPATARLVATTDEVFDALSGAGEVTRSGTARIDGDAATLRDLLTTIASTLRAGRATPD